MVSVELGDVVNFTTKSQNPEDFGQAAHLYQRRPNCETRYEMRFGTQNQQIILKNICFIHCNNR